jgi:mRNA-degrading endonuclease RelE of RelBE toxin-antitoxin system
MRVLEEEMTRDPFAGDVIPLTNERAAYRRRVGNWRIFFDVDREKRLVDVTDIDRRTTTTYRKR